MSQRHILALFSNFEDAEAVIYQLRAANIQGFNFDDLTLKSPIEHHEVEDILGERPAKVQLFTLVGAVMGGLLGFFLISGAQANFYAQLKGGKPKVPLPPFIECAARNMAFNWSASGESRSRANNRLSILPSCSTVSSKNA